MEIAMKDNQILMRNLDSVQYNILRNTGKCIWDKKKQMLIGDVSLELLDTLNQIIRLPERIKAEYIRLKRVQNAIDKERMNENPVPLVKYPVKLPLFAHQIRGANLALLAFGVVDPPCGGETDGICE